MRSYYCICIGLMLAACSQEKPVSEPKAPTLQPLEISEVAEKPKTIKKKKYSELPKRSQPYLHLIDRQSPNASWFAALVDTESRYDPFAISPAGAYGLTQIMPSNHEWLENGMCSHLGRAKPEDPNWQMKCGQILFDWGGTWSKYPPLESYCDNLFLKSMAYNGGYYVFWEVNYGGRTITGGKKICGTILPNGRKRNKGSCDENYKYPVTISTKQQLFKKLGGKQCLTKF